VTRFLVGGALHGGELLVGGLRRMGVLGNFGQLERRCLVAEIGCEVRRGLECRRSVGLGSGEARHVAECIGSGDRRERSGEAAGSGGFRGILQIDDRLRQRGRLRPLRLGAAAGEEFRESPREPDPGR